MQRLGLQNISPIIDCYDGMSVSWAIGIGPTAELASTMLRQAVATLKPGDKPIIHSDRDGRYRRPEWIKITEKAFLTRSMSNKDCSPDNSACEALRMRCPMSEIGEMFCSGSYANSG